MPGTAAAGSDDHVPKAVVQERFDRLVELQERMSLERNEAEVGRSHEVLVEGRGRKGGVQGRTRTHKLVILDADLPSGAFADVRIERAHPHHLSGSVLAPVAG